MAWQFKPVNNKKNQDNGTYLGGGVDRDLRRKKLLDDFGVPPLGSEEKRPSARVSPVGHSHVLIITFFSRYHLSGHFVIDSVVSNSFSSQFVVVYITTD